MGFEFRTPSASPSLAPPASGANRVPLGSPSFSSFTDFFRLLRSRSGQFPSGLSFAEALRVGSLSPAIPGSRSVKGVWKGILGPPPSFLPRSPFRSASRSSWNRDVSRALNAPTTGIYSPGGCSPAFIRLGSSQFSRGKQVSLAALAPGKAKVSARCFRCGERGHLKRVCRNGLRCFRCGGIGHSARICSRSRPSSSAKIPAIMDHSGDIARLSAVRRLSLPPDPPPGPADAENGHSINAFIPLLQSHRARYDDLASVGVLELYPLSRGLPLPTVDQARRILLKNFPSPVWQPSWDPIPFGPALFLVRFASRASLLQAFRCGVLWGRRFSCSLRPWSFKDGGSPTLLDRRVFLKLSHLPLLLRDLVSVRALISGFGILTDPLPDFSAPVDWSAIDIAVLVEAEEDVPSFISATLGDARYVIKVAIRGSDSFTASAALPAWQDGEPDWDAAEDEMDHFLDDVSDPIDLDSDALEEPAEDPSEDPVEDPGSSSSGHHHLLVHKPLDPSACGSPGSSASVVWTSSSSVSLLLGCLPVQHCFSLGIYPAAAPPVDFPLSLLGRPPPLCRVSADSSPHAFKSQVCRSSVFIPSPRSSVSPGEGQAEGDNEVAPVVRPLVCSPSPCSKPRRMKAVLSVRIAAAKTVSQKKAASLLPLALADTDMLLSWMKSSGFDVEDARSAQIISGLRSLELSKAC